MPAAILYYREESDVPVLDWLLEQPTAVQDECLAHFGLLAEFGHALRRPHAENLGQGIYELRVRVGRVHYRVLYFFHGQGVVVLAAGFSKEGKVPPVEIRRAAARKTRFESNPARHTAEVEL